MLFFYCLLWLFFGHSFCSDRFQYRLVLSNSLAVCLGFFFCLAPGSINTLLNVESNLINALCNHSSRTLHVKEGGLQEIRTFVKTV